jgi:hypothetical protein
MDDAKVHGSRHWLSGFPHLVAEWDTERNGGLTPNDVSAGSARRIWWVCARGPDHNWRASANNRTTGDTGCPFCANRRASITNCLATVHPEIAAELDEDNELPATMLVATTTRVCLWRCRTEPRHTWRAMVRDRTRHLTGCPYCARRLPDAATSLAVSCPNVAREWHEARNGALTPNDVLPGSNRIVWWQCSTDGAHVWRASILNRVSRGSGCPQCAAERTRRPVLRALGSRGAARPRAETGS